MKEIGEKLKETRESMGISINEAAEDLKLRPSQLQNIEEGNQEAFKDIFYLKYFIRDYAKYLGLDYEEIVSDFNEFVFDYTSKISLEDIKKASRPKEKKDKRKIMSPYTIDRDTPKNIPLSIVYGIIILMVCLIIYAIVLFLNNKNTDDDKGINNREEVSYVISVISRCDIYD